MCLQRLPVHIQQLLLWQAGDMDAVAEYADRLCEMNPHSVASIDHGKKQQDRFVRLEAQLERMSKAMERMMSVPKKQAEKGNRKAAAS